MKKLEVKVSNGKIKEVNSLTLIEAIYFMEELYSEELPQKIKHCKAMIESALTIVVTNFYKFNIVKQDLREKYNNIENKGLLLISEDDDDEMSTISKKLCEIEKDTSSPLNLKDRLESALSSIDDLKLERYMKESALKGSLYENWIINFRGKDPTVWSAFIAEDREDGLYYLNWSKRTIEFHNRKDDKKIIVHEFY